MHVFVIILLIYLKSIDIAVCEVLRTMFRRSFSKILGQSSSILLKKPEASISQPDKSVVDVPSQSPKPLGWTRERVEGLFDSLCGSKGACSLGNEGIVALLKALGLAEDDFEVLVLLYKLKCKSLLDIEREEFIEGMRELDLMEWGSLKKKLTIFTEELMNNEKEFAAFYAYIFQTCREGTIKSIPKAIGIYLLPICFSKFGTTEKQLVNKFCEFLEKSDEIKHLKADEWNSFLRFSRQFKNVDEYDSGDHWPLLIDDFVESGRNMKESGSKEKGKIPC